MSASRPNLLFVFGDQWRRQALGCTGDPNVKTPRVDRFADQAVECPNATAGWPVCCPWRASLLTGQYPLTHGMIVNDQTLRSDRVSLAEAFNRGGYHTAWIGKWHVDGRGRTACVAPDRREGFALWRGFECNHNYVDSFYWDDRCDRHRWEGGYDAQAQTVMASRYLADRAGKGQPFALFVSWGPPHDPYQTAPAEYRKLYDPAKLTLRPNVPASMEAEARQSLAGYYAHCTALDDCFGQLLDQLDACKLADNTIVVFTSDHGDMHGSHGLRKKQHPYAESIEVPLLIRWPAGLGASRRQVDSLVNAADLMPTLLGLCGLEIPPTVQGADFSPAIRGQRQVDDGGALLACYQPFHEIRKCDGFREFRGLRTLRHTYVRHRDKPWLLFDNQSDPYQLTNLIDDPAHAGVTRELDQALWRKLGRLADAFEPGEELLRRFSVRLNEQGDVAIWP